MKGRIVTNKESQRPKVFISHSSDDKERFVLGFASRLREAGVDAWLDKWEMLPGDPLVDRIFEGVKDADALVIVLSRSSVKKKWVREEINSGFVERIENGTKLIPVVIEDCEVPECLKSTLYIRISELSSYDDELKTILMAIFGATDKPPVGDPPEFTKQPAEQIEGLTQLDSDLLTWACEAAMKQERFSGLDTDRVRSKAAEQGYPSTEVEESMELLHETGYIELRRTMGRCHTYRIEVRGFDSYARATNPQYDALICDVSLAIVNEQLHDRRSIVEAVCHSKLLVEHVLMLLEDQGYIDIRKTIGRWYLSRVSPSLKRLLNEVD